jgi:DNA-directed RNA polymerase subunit RPC12/RpoP
MGRERQTDEGNLYGRVLQRLTMALEEAERTADGKAGAMGELEVGGLTPAEFDLIRAYLQQDSQWLSGWHAAAEEQAQLVRQATRPALRNVLRHHSSKRCKQSPPALQQSMTCALCGASVHWPEGAGVIACSACGSQLLRARQRLHTYPKH